MSLRINTNVEALNAHRQLTLTESSLNRSMQKLSSGLRINTAADDAAGLAISEKMRAQIRGTAQAQRNAMDAISLVQTAEGAIAEIQSIIQRVRELAVEYNNGTMSSVDRAAVTVEVAQLSAEVKRIIQVTAFNGIQMLQSAQPITFQVGANGGETIAVNALDLGNAATWNYFGGVFQNAFTATMSDIDLVHAALSSVSDLRAQLGAVQNRLEHTVNNLAAYHENLSSAESRIRDADMAEEMTDYTKYQILQQSGMSMLAQANQGPRSVLSLLQQG